MCGESACPFRAVKVKTVAGNCMLLCLSKNSWNLRGYIVKKLLVVLGVVKPTSILQGMLELELI